MNISSFASRLVEIVAAFPSRAALAKKAGLTPSALQSYVEGAEPTRPALVALARAAGGFFGVARRRARLQTAPSLRARWLR
jgi:helix-turn-helix protein